MLLFGKEESADDDTACNSRPSHALIKKRKRRTRAAANCQQRWRKEVTRMALDLQQERQQAHALLDLLSPAKLGAVRSLLEVMIDHDVNEELTEEDRRSLRASDEYFRNGGRRVPFEQVVADLGFTMDQIREAKKEL